MSPDNGCSEAAYLPTQKPLKLCLRLWTIGSMYPSAARVLGPPVYRAGATAGCRPGVPSEGNWRLTNGAFGRFYFLKTFHSPVKASPFNGYGANPNLAISFRKEPGRISGDMPSSIEACRVTTCFRGFGSWPIALALAKIWRTRSFVTPTWSAISQSRNPSPRRVII